MDVIGKQPAQNGGNIKSTGEMFGVVPRSLDSLSRLHKLIIHPEASEGTCTWKHKTFRICDALDQELLHGKDEWEKSGSGCMGSHSNLVYSAFDQYGTNVLHVRILKHSFSTKADIQAPEGNSVGSSSKLMSWKNKFMIADKDGEKLYTVEQQSLLKVGTFKVLDNEEKEVGDIVIQYDSFGGKWSGMRNYTITFPADLDLNSKILIFGSTFFIEGTLQDSI